MPSLTTIYWRDIPAQVVVKQGRKRARQELPQRFQKAIDRAAMRAKKVSEDAYLDDWRRVAENVQGDIEALAQSRAEALDAAYDEARLEALVRNHGLDPENAQPDEPAANPSTEA